MTTRQRPLLLLFAICVAAVFSVVAPPQPATGHVADDPHVPYARYHGFDTVVFDKGPGVADGWQLAAVVQELSDDISGPHPGTIRLGECENLPGKCIIVSQTNNGPGDSSIDWNNDGPDRLKLNTAGGTGATRAEACNAVSAMWGMHPHNNPSGCSRHGYTTSNTHISAAEEAAFDQAYCPGVGCRRN